MKTIHRRSARPNRIASSSVAALLEPLEPRSLLAAPYPFAAVGIRFDTGPEVFLAQGTIEADDSITGSMRFATLAGGPGADQPIDWTSYNRGPRSSFSFGTRGGFTPYDTQSGTQFLESERFAEGSFVGRAADGSPRDLAFLLERTYANPIFDESNIRFALRDGMQFQMTRLSEGPLETFSVDVTFNLNTPGNFPLSLDFVYHLASGDVAASHLITDYEDGFITLDDGQVLVVSGPGTMLLADMNNSDGIVGIATGRVRLTGWQQNNQYRGAVMLSGPVAAAFFGIDPDSIGPAGVAVADVVLELKLNDTRNIGNQFNSFTIYRRAEFDAGNRVPVASGNWHDAVDARPPGREDSFHLVLTTDAGVIVTARGTRNAIFFDDARTTAGGHEELSGVVSHAFTPGDALGLVEFFAAVDNDGRPIAYADLRLLDELSTPDLFSVDLIDEVGGEAVEGELVSWTYNGAHFWAGLAADGDVQLWRFDYVNGWGYTNITEEVPAARGITGELFFTEYSSFGVDPTNLGSRQQFLSGTDADGNFVAYRQLSASWSRTNITWAFMDVENDGFNDDATMPDFVTPLVGWGSSWGGAHFAGLDADGDIWSVWWIQSFDRWQVSNVSDATGVARVTLDGPLSVVRTPWDAFHLYGTSLDGDLISTWWAPGLDQWEVNNLTDELDGPQLTSGSITGNFSHLIDTMNVVGLDNDGQVRVYWWTPGTEWNINSLSATIDPADIPLEPRHMVSATWQIGYNPPYPRAASQSLLGRNADGHVVRLYWATNTADAWVLQDITDISRPYFA